MCGMHGCTLLTEARAPCVLQVEMAQTLSDELSSLVGGEVPVFLPAPENGKELL